MKGEKGDEKRETAADREKHILTFWKENAIFEKSERGISGTVWDTIRGFFVRKKQFFFYDGPPFATGLPHYGHILASAVKDAIPRYKTMRGHIVRRRWGWDCHGLPLEVEMEKKIGSLSRKDIEAYGVERFNRGICDVIFQYVDEWKRIIPRIGRWVDMENDYRTVHTGYIESVWGVFHRLHQRGFVGKGFKSLHLCPRCATVVSNTEVSESYEMLTDTAVYVLFPLKDDPTTCLVAWTTTPWTLFGNVALGVGRDREYLVISDGGKKYVVHENAKHLFSDGEVVAVKKGSDFIGKEYLPPFTYLYPEGERVGEEKNAWKIYDVPYIDTTVGTGVVHLAPAYGADDLEVARKYRLPVRHHVSKDGVFMPGLGSFSGLRPKEKDNPKDVDEKILAELRANGVLLKSERIEHSYPVCWRCATPLLNYATDSWFVHTDQYRDRMVAENKKVAWVPEHIRDGRFGHWLQNAQAWAVSRSRFWGAPLPVWRVEKTGEHLVISSLEDMFKRMRAKNTYTFIRHGHAVSNETQVLRCLQEDGYGLTEKGKAQAKEVAGVLRDSKPAVIFCSPLTRTRETAEYVAKETGASIVEDDLLIEIQVPEMHGRPYHELRDLVMDAGAFRDMRKKIGSGESYLDVYLRLLRFLEKVDREYEGAHIIVVTHKVVMGGVHMVESISVSKYDHLRYLWMPGLGNANTLTLAYKHVKRTEDGEVDLHRPYIDGVELYDDDGNVARHIGEVFDCWFESGSMPYGSHQYPFLNTGIFNPMRNQGFPADFICEGLDQTRGWFYSLLAIGVGAFDRAPYRQVIATGIIRAADGRKMSKRLKNYSDPMDIVERYGADSLRHYLLGSPVVRGESLDFSDEQVDEVHKKVYARLHNCLNFYTTYGHLPHKSGSRHPLDVYICSRLSEMHAAMTDGFESYRLDVAVAPIGSFVDDLSTWYLRRSRDRLRHDTEDGAYARETMRYILLQTAKCIAPIAPFYAEYLYLQMSKYHPVSFSLPESVHLCRWPGKTRPNRAILAAMRHVRTVVSVAHEHRARAGIKVRQPLARLTLKTAVPDVLKTIIADEVRVKEVVVDSGSAQEVSLDTTLTPELLAEGFVRTCIRAIQNLRREQGLSLTEKVGVLHISLPSEQEGYVRHYEGMVKRETQVKEIAYTRADDAVDRTLDGVPASLFLVDRPEKLFS